MMTHRQNSSPMPTRLRGGRCGLAGVMSLILVATRPLAQANNSVADFSIEDLINVKVTSVSKKEQNLFDAATAIAVISNEDIHRSGATSIPDALRFVPGMNVAAVNSSQWAISTRGHNGSYANKLLVLVDGRVVYNPSFAGVYWDLQQTIMEDVDRIEVIRGPGATIWGANAVNGVINVMTRSARDTQGGLVYGGGGDVLQAMGGGRYGGKLGENTYYRVFADYQLHDDYPLANGQSTQDNWQSEQLGFRLDHYAQPDTHLTWQSSVTALDLDNRTSDAYNVNTLGRWTREFSDRSSVQLQAYYDQSHRNESLRAEVLTDTFDFSAQHSFSWGERNNLIWGFGAQHIQSKFTQLNSAIVIENDHTDANLFNIFVQDELRLVPDRLILTAGTKLEHNDYTGFEIEPSLRAALKITPKQTLWAAVSRAVRTPSVLEGQRVLAVAIADPFVGPGGSLYVPRAVGNKDIQSEVLWAYEAGYRIQPAEHTSVDLAAFYNQYDRLQIWSATPTQFNPGVPAGTAELPWGNYLSGKTYGCELSVTVNPLEAWRLVGSYSLLLSDITGVDPADRMNSAPKHQASLRSSYDFNKRTSLDIQVRYVDKKQGAAAYIATDFRLAYRPTDKIEISLVGQNLFDKQHAEFGSEFFVVNSESPRSFYGKITWKF